MSCIHTATQDIEIPEGTTRHVVVTVKDQDGTSMDLSGYEACLYIKQYEHEIEKSCAISGNEISVTIDPEDTVAKNSMSYEIRIYKETEVYEVVRGRINVLKSIHPCRNN